MGSVILRSLIPLFNSQFWAKICLIFGLLLSNHVLAESYTENWKSFIAGGFATILVHELGHMAVAEIHDVDFEYDGVTIVYPQQNFTSSEHLRIASAGFQTQWIASEFALRKLAKPDPMSRKARSFTRGIVAGHVAITVAYLTFLKNHNDGDIQGMSQATGVSNNELALIVAIPAVLDSWRLTAKDVPAWVPKLSVAFKGLGISAIWTY